MNDPGKDRLDSILDQFKLARNGQRDKIHCPYCGEMFKFSGGDREQWKRPFVSPYCCDQMQAAAAAIAERMMLQVYIDTKKRIEDAMSAGRPSKLIH